MSDPRPMVRCRVRRTRPVGVLGLALGLGVLAAGVAAQAPDVEHLDSVAGVDAARAAAYAGPVGQPARATQGNTHLVLQCGDSGWGTLRAIMAIAEDGDSINLSACYGTIQLESPLSTSVDNLTIDGVTPTDSNGPILQGDDSFRIIQHLGTGTLTLRNLTLANGLMRDGPGRGGCVSSLGSVEVEDSILRQCVAERTGSSTSVARGGAIYAGGDVTIRNSSILESQAIGANGGARGGAIHAAGRAEIYTSNIALSRADTVQGDALGGAIFAGDGLYLFETYVGENVASSIEGNASGGGIYVAGGPLYNRVMESHIVDNIASSLVSQRGAGIAAAKNAAMLTLRNTVVTGNQTSGSDDSAFGGGVFVNENSGLYTWHSTISENSAGDGGGIFSRSGLLMEFTTVAYNKASVMRGAIFVRSGPVTLENSVIHHNEAPRIGGSQLNTSSSEVIRIEQCTIAHNRTVDATHEDWGFGTGLVLLADTVMLNSTVSRNEFWAATGSASETPPGGRGVGITLGPNVQLDASSSVLMGNWRSLTSAAVVWYSDLAAPAGSGWSGDHNAVQRGGLGLEPEIIPPGNLGLDDAGLLPLADNGDWTWTMLPKYGSKLVNAGLDNGFLWDQRGEPHARVVAGAADIGAAESCHSDLIFRDSFEDELGPPLCAP